MQNETMFETSNLHESSMLGNPEGSFHEFEFEGEAGQLGNPEFELEFEGNSASYGEYQPEWQEFEFEASPSGGLHEANLFGYQEQGFEANPNSFLMQGEYQPEMQSETDRMLESLLGSGGTNFSGYGELSGEADPFIGKAFRRIRQVARHLAPLAKMIAPHAIRALSSVVPIPGAAMVGQLVASQLREVEKEVAQLENQLVNAFANNDIVREAGQAQNEAIQEAALAELLAAQAAEAQTEAEAEASIAATLPITIRITGTTRLVRPVTPVVVQARARLVATLRQRNPQLVRLFPAMDRLALSLVRQIARQGRPVSAALILTAYTTAARRIMGNPRLASQALARNLGVQVRTSPPGQRIAVYRPRPIAQTRPRMF